MLEFRVLGPVQAVRDGRELALGGPRRRAVLALLLVAGGRVVPAEQLADELWGGCPAAGGGGNAARARVPAAHAAEPGCRAGGAGWWLCADGAGPGQLDAARFERLAGAGREALEQGDAAAAASRFREALGLWRGRALADVAEVEPLAREGARLEELRLVATEGRIEADLALGRAAEVTGELEGLVAEYPVRERLWRLLVLALYRAGRQADALAAYRRAREMLAAELGIEPGAELRALEQAVLRQEVPAPPPMARHNLPVRLTSFLGREQELAAVDGLVGEGRLVTLTGPGGAGKTRLALEFAAGAVERFGDGVWLAGLSGVADPRLVGSAVMDALGLRQSGDVPILETLRNRLRSAELLLVLDNCEHLLGGCAELAVGAAGQLPPAAGAGHQPGGAGRARRGGVCGVAAAGAARVLGCGGAGPCARGAAVPGARPGRPGPGRQRRRSRWWPGSAGSWTGCRWRSSWPPRALACCRRRRSRPAWPTSSGSWPTGDRWLTRGTGR